MEDFWGKVLAFTAFLLLVAYIIQEYCLNSGRREMTYTEQQTVTPQELQWQHISMFNPAIPVIPGMTVIATKNEVADLRDNPNGGTCAVCFSPANLRCSPCKSVQYCSGRCQIIHWRKGHKEACRTSNESAIATTGLTTQQTPHIHGSKNKQGRLLDDRSDKQSSKLKEADPSSLFSHGLKEDGMTVRQNNPENQREFCSTIHRWGMNLINEAINTEPVKHAFDDASQVKVKSEMDCQESVIMEKTRDISTRETQRLKHQLAKERTKLRELEKINDKVLEENQALQSMQHDMEKELECLRQQKDEKESKNYDGTTICMEFSLSELQEATSNFNKKLKIGEGGYGSVYKGDLHCTKVAIKVLHSKSNQGEREFSQEVEILRKVRHPNILTLIGGCSQIQALIYEFIPNGGLDSYLGSTSRRKLLSWKIRVQIASDICSALIFLHSTKPHGIAHGDLKPANILLDSNYQGKLSDFGISRHLVKTNDTITPHHITDQPKGTLAYIDPEYIQIGEMNPQCDVYAFGIILLQLVTGKSATGINKLVQEALKSKKLDKEIDVSANWPSDKAIKMAKLGICCCNPARKKRPDLATEVWREIESLKPRSTVF